VIGKGLVAGGIVEEGLGEEIMGMRMAFGLSLQVSIPTRFKKRAAATPMPRHADEKERRLTGLMIRALEGDAEAYRSLLHDLVPIIREFFSERIGPTSNDLEELVQETLIAVHLRRRTYSPERDLLRWLYAIAGHTLSLHRKIIPDHAPFSTFGGNPHKPGQITAGHGWAPERQRVNATSPTPRTNAGGGPDRNHRGISPSSERA
jgi:hypothetical protein